MGDFRFEPFAQTERVALIEIDQHGVTPPYSSEGTDFEFILNQLEMSDVSTDTVFNNTMGQVNDLLGDPEHRISTAARDAYHGFLYEAFGLVKQLTDAVNTGQVSTDTGYPAVMFREAANSLAHSFAVKIAAYRLDQELTQYIQNRVILPPFYQRNGIPVDPGDSHDLDSLSYESALGLIRASFYAKMLAPVLMILRNNIPGHLVCPSCQLARPFKAAVSGGGPKPWPHNDGVCFLHRVVKNHTFRMINRKAEVSDYIQPVGYGDDKNRAVWSCQISQLIMHRLAVTDFFENDMDTCWDSLMDYMKSSIEYHLDYAVISRELDHETA